MNETTILNISKVTKKYGDHTIFRDLDLSIPKGSVMGLIGKNGAGKSTLLKCALGLIKPQSGSIQIFGEDVWNLSAESKARLGYAPQTPQLYSWMRVRQMIAFTAAFYSRWNHELITRLITQWELKPEARISSLSVGEAQKVSILLALGHEPDFLILDEPAASLDPIARRQFLSAIIALTSNRDRTVIFSTHLSSDLERVADSVAILKDGGIVFSGELDTLKENVKRLQIHSSQSLDGGLSFSFPGILYSKISGNEATIVVSQFTSELLSKLEKDLKASVQVQDLNLEDAFLEFHHETK
jgi:ABC-2 type transport system ATP-binding protein